MSKNDNEWMSAFVDNESIEQTQLDALDSDSLETLKRYQLYSDILKGDAGHQIHIDVVGKVAAALKDEPAILAPNSGEPSQEHANSGAKAPANVVSLFGRFSQYAVAASVAALVVLGVQYQTGDSETNQPVLQTAPIMGSAAPVSFNAPSINVEQTQKKEQLQQLKLNAYTQDHQLHSTLYYPKPAQK